MFRRICESVYLVGGGEFSDDRDCLVYLLNLGDMVLVDCGCGPGWPRIKDNISEAGFDPSRIHTLILTHCHVDHIGAVSSVIGETGCVVVAHEKDADAIETGDSRKTAADWYGMKLPAVSGIVRIAGDRRSMSFSGGALELIHTPGHTPGSISIMMESAGKKVLFGQDIHGPFDPAFGSDIREWRKSMERLLALEPDILCEGHYGVFQPAGKACKFIEDQLKRHPFTICFDSTRYR